MLLYDLSTSSCGFTVVVRLTERLVFRAMASHEEDTVQQTQVPDDAMEATATGHEEALTIKIPPPHSEGSLPITPPGSHTSSSLGSESKESASSNQLSTANSETNSSNVSNGGGASQASQRSGKRRRKPEGENFKFSKF